MSAEKRIADINQKRATACLNCNKIMPRSEMRDGTVFYCGSCGFAHSIKRAGSTLTLIASQKEESKQDSQADQVKKLEKALQESIKREREWRAAAEGLARMIEELAAGDTK